MTAVLDESPDSGSMTAAWSGPVIDADAHVCVPSLDALLPYLDRTWREYTRERNWTGPGNIAFTYPPALNASVRPEWRPTDGTVPASQLGLLREHVLDTANVEVAVLNCYYGLDALRHPDWSAAVVRALNDWLVAQWLEQDDRLRASLVVPARDPAAMVAEIRRVGHHPGFVQVLMPVRSDRLYGNRSWYPVYEAMLEHDLVFGLHWGGTTDTAVSPSGWASWYVEEYAAEQQVYAAQITSLVSEGAFQALPDLRMTVGEIGFLWLPTFLWRLDKDWKGLRREVPWLSVPPSNVVRDHVRFATAPMDLGPSDELGCVIEWLESDDLLMFGSDYPHFHDDDLASLLGAMPTAMQAKTMADNARAWYRL